MTDKHIFYDYEGNTLKIPVEEQKEFERNVPSAKMLLTYQGNNLSVPLNELKGFINDVGKDNVSYSVYDDNNEYNPSASVDKYESYEKPSVVETVAKGLGAAGVGTAKLAVDLGQNIWESTAGLFDGRKGSDVIRDENNALSRASMKLGELQERLSRDADPTGGEVGFGELIRQGKIGMAAQKALGSGLESLPMMLAAGTGWGALLYGAGMAAGKYSDETRENADVPTWKRGVNAIGSAALEMAVEKIGGPLKNIGGKAAKELTEPTAKEIIEDVATTGAEKVASRIASVLKKTGKQGLEEGGEELLTSFGNDALGEALDIIDGDKDYGIRAQWEKMQQENPNADLGDFAMQKGKEYIDSFLGGALSGMEIAGTVETTKEVGRANTINRINESRKFGETLDLQNMYDVNEKVNEVSNTAVEAFSNEKGKPAVSREFFDGLTADEAFALSESEDISYKQRAALENVALAKAAQEGLTQKLDNRVNEQISSVTAIANDAAEDGSVVVGKYNGKPVYVKGGVVNNSAITLSDGSNGPVIVVDMMTGEKTTVQSNEIVGASSMNVEQFNKNMSDMLRGNDQTIREQARNTMSPVAKMAAIQPYAGRKLLINGENGTIEVYVQEVKNNGDVIIKGKKGDLNGQSFITMGASAFYDSIYRDENGNPVITNLTEEEKAELEKVEATETVEEPAVADKDIDYRGEIVTININGRPVDVEVVSQDSTADSIVYEYTDENGKLRNGSSTIGAFQSAIVPVSEAAPVVEETVETVEETPVAEPVEQVAEEKTELEPEDIDWDNLFEQDKEAYLAELQKQFGDETLDILNEEIETAQNEIDALGKAKTKSQNERLANRKKKIALQERINALNGMISKLTASNDVEVAEEAEVETPVVEDTAEEVVETPVAEEAAEPVIEEPVAEEAVVEEPEESEAQPVVEEAAEPVVETPVEEPASDVKPVAPNPVADPIKEAKKIEAHLEAQLNRNLPIGQKQDLAKSLGKKVADLFATREEYEAYQEDATDFGAFNEYFDEGVEESFVNRNNVQKAGETEGNSVPLGTEPNVEQDGKQTEQPQGEDTIRQGNDTVGRGSDDGGVETANTGDKETEQELGKGESETVEEVKKEYPTRKGNATRKILEDIFGFSKVSIPNTESTVLNTVYDFMMEMSKMLGVSPNVIGNGGWLDVANLRSNANASAAYSWKNRPDGEVVEPRLRLKYGRISSIAHEWWHSLDHVLKFFNTSKGRSAATANISLLNSFGVRKEVQFALADLLKTMKDSGYEHRIASMSLPFKYKYYLLENEEMTARAFDAYINDKFEAAGIEVENAVYERTPYQPTPEEMEVIAPAFDNLFKVLKEKEGKKAGTSVLYHIGEQMKEGSEAWRLATNAVIKKLIDSGINVIKATDAQTAEMLRIKEELSNPSFELMTVYHGSGAKFDKFDHSHMGEGEGAQAHGWGTYVAVNPDTSVTYANMMGGGTRVLMNGEDVTDIARTVKDDPNSPSAYLISIIKALGSVENAREEIVDDLYDVNRTIDFYKDEIEKNRDEFEYYLTKQKKLEKALDILDYYDWSVEERKSQFYTVEIPDNTGDNYFDEQNLSEEQVERLVNALEKEGKSFLDIAADASSIKAKDGGRRMYKALINEFGSEKAASEFLSRAGFVGIKYHGRADGDCFVIFNEADAKITGRTEFYQTPNGTVYGWTDGKKIYLTEAGINPNTPVHEYTHLWAKAMMQKNPKGWNSVKNLLKGTPVWGEVLSDSNYSNIHNDEDAVTSEVLSRISGSKNALKLEQMAQQMIDEAKGTMRKLEAQGLIQRIKDALNEFWNWVGVELFGIEKFESVEQIADRVLWDLMNKTDLGNTSEGTIEAQLSKSSVEKNYGGLWIADMQEYAKFASAVNQYVFEKDGRGITFTDNHLYAYYWNNQGVPIPYVDIYLNDNESQDVVNSVKEYHEIVNGNEDIREILDNVIDSLRRNRDRVNDSSSSNEGTSLSRTNGRVGNNISREGKYANSPELYVTSVRPDERTTKTTYREAGTTTTINPEFKERKVSSDKITPEMDAEYLAAVKAGDMEKAQKMVVEAAKMAMPNTKVVDENGNPLIVYHGSPYGGITSFDRKKGQSSSGLKEFGSYFGTNKELAELYRTGRKISENLKNDITDEIYRLRAIQERIANSSDYDAIENEIKRLENTLNGRVYPVFLNIENPKTFDAKEKDGWAGWHELKQDVGYDVKSGVEAIEAIAGHNDAAIMPEQYDGIIAKNIADVHAEGDSVSDLLGDVYLVFDENPSQIKSAEPVTYDDNGNIIPLSKRFNDEVEDIRYNITLDPETVSQETAKQTYDRVVNNDWQEFQRQFQDAYQPVRIAIDAIQQETGNIPVEDYENYLLIQNLSSSRSRVEIDKFQRRYYSPIVNQINKIIDQLLESRGLDIKNKENRANVYEEVIKYLIAKHGLERNEYYQTHKKRKMKESEQKPLLAEAKREFEGKATQINTDASLTEAERELQLRNALDEYNALVLDIKGREVADMRDYAGLTALFNLDSKEYEEAQRLAREAVEKFESTVSTDALWNKINAATNKTLKHSYESGMLSRQQFNDIKSMFKFYIPLRGFSEDTAEDVYSYARFEGNRFNPAVKTAKGRTSLADDPIAIIMNMAESEITQGNKNKAKQALYYYVLNRPVVDAEGNQSQNSLMQVEDVWYVVSTDDNGNETHQIAAPNHDAGESYAEFENRMKTLAEEGKAYKSKKGGVDVGMRFQKQANKNAHYVYLKINGVDKAIYINGDPKAAEAINGTYKTKPLPPAKIKVGDKEITVDIKAIQRNISSTFTNYSLEFTARNYFRDLIYSNINIGIKESDPEYRKKFRQNWRHNNMRSMMTMLKAYRNGELEGRPLTEDEAAFVEFMENGGQTGYTIINSVEARKKELEDAIKRMQEGVDKGGIKDSTIFKMTLGGVELLNEASELVTRFAAYKTSRDMGRSVVKSISDAKEITVNFNTKGAQDGKGFFGKIAQYFGWSKYFFNASVQGVQNITAMAKANKLRFCTTVGSIAATGFMMPLLVSMVSEILGGGDDEEYWNIPEYDRQNNLCIPLGNGKYAKIPLPIGFREVYAIGDMVAAMAFDRKFTRDVNQIGMDIANKIASILLPVNPLESSANGLSIWASIGNVVLPSSAQFITQNWTNMDWKGAPLQKEFTYNENDPQWMKAYASNPLWMKSLSRWCNENIGAGDMAGWDWSPEKLDNTLSNLFGGVYSLIKKGGRSISMIWNEENRNLSNVPLAGVVAGSGIDSDDRFITDAYFEMKEYYDNRLSFIKRRAEMFGYDLDDVFLKKKGTHHPKMQEIYLNDNFDFMQEWYKGNEELKEYKNNVKKIEKEIAKKQYVNEVLLNKLSDAKLKLENERREFVDDMLELD